MNNDDELMKIRVGLEHLAMDRHDWEKARRRAIYAACCRETAPLIEVMNTNPPSVLIGQAVVAPGVVADGGSLPMVAPGGGKIGAWRGYGSDGRDVVWLSTFERMAGTNLRYHVWCPDHHFYVSSSRAPRPAESGAIWVPLDEVLTRKGIHIVALPDKSQ